MNTLYTIGYGGKTAAGLAAQLKAEEIEVLVDVRYQAMTRGEFNKFALRKFMPLHGIRYRHLNALGNRNYRSDGPVELLSPVLGAVELQMVLVGSRAAIMCVCHNWQTCHRKTVSDLMQRRHPELEVVHLEKQPRLM